MVGGRASARIARATDRVVLSIDGPVIGAIRAGRIQLSL
jgi:hypothetical protein